MGLLEGLTGYEAGLIHDMPFSEIQIAGFMLADTDRNDYIGFKINFEKECSDWLEPEEVRRVLKNNYTSYKQLEEEG